LKQKYKEEDLYTKKSKYSKHTKENYTKFLCTIVWQEKEKFNFKNIFMHNPLRDNVLSTSKKNK
jgi:hypothetical protein